MTLPSALAVQRTRRIRYAIASSLASKVTTAAVQILALPLAATSLGIHGFAVYMMMAAAVGWLGIANLGIGPVVNVKIAAAHAGEDAELERVIFSSGLSISLSLAVVVASLALVLIWVIPIRAIFGPLYVAESTGIRLGMSCLVAFFFVQTSVSVFEAAQAGYQEQYIQNVVAAVSSLPVLMAVWLVARYHPTPVALIWALGAPPLAFRVGNAVAVVWRHPAIKPSVNFVKSRMCRSLVKTGSVYSLAGGLASFLAHVFPVLLVGRLSNSMAAVGFAATMNMVILLNGMVSMLASPLWPAVADSLARGDLAWARRAASRVVWLVTSFGLIVAGFLWLRGEWLFAIWYSGAVQPGHLLLVAAGLYFLAFAWEQAHFSILVGLHQIGKASVLVCSRAVVGIIFFFVARACGYTDASVSFFAMLLAIITIDLVPLRMIVLQKLRE